ncbi:MAG TPA: hypothetical protein VHG91_08440 [Longimicrobium sp.]|nr:hypothetical protein [Longimicrobium sp.]
MRALATHHHPLRRFGLLALVALTAAGCVTAGKRFEQGVELEQRGQPAEAAARYIDALRRDPNRVEARARLQDAGDRAVQQYLAEVEAAAAGGRDHAAANVLLRVDELRRDAAGVGVQLAVPADYAQRRRATLDRAIAQAVREADAAAARGEFSGGLDWLQRAAEHWQPTAAQRGELDRARFGVQLSWAERELSGGRFRAAYDRAEGAVRVLGRESAQARRALEIQDEALRRGTVRVAVLPVGAETAMRAKLPGRVLRALNDALEEEHWGRAPLFVEVVDPRDVGRAMRREGYTDRQVLSTREASLLARDLNADLVIVAELDSVATEVTAADTVRRPARTRAGADTAYSVVSGREATWARVDFAVVSAADRRIVDQASVSAEGGARFRRGVYSGDWRTLNLSREERDLFDPGAKDDVDDELTRELVDGLSARLGRDVFDRLLRRIN